LNCDAAEQQKVVARVNGTPITEAELQKGLDAYIRQSTYHKNVTEDIRREKRQPALDFVIELELLYQEAKARGMTVTESEIEKVLKEKKEKFKDKKAFDKALNAEGMTIDDFRRLLRKGELIRKISRTEIEEKAKYSDKELEDYYSANKEKYIKPEGFKLRHIFVKASPDTGDNGDDGQLNKAKDILKMAQEGKDFSELAYDYSEDAYRVKGGDIGWVHIGRMEPAIEEAALKLKVGEISELIVTESGFHIIKLEEKKPAEQSSFSEVKVSLRKRLESKRYKETREAFIKSLKDKAKIEIY